ncbi:MAG: hypothetical protein GKR97_02910 [Rhizobiaceae bacterium]|nr:hypothetical protein [Rhizobiaceae bacterium]
MDEIGTGGAVKRTANEIITSAARGVQEIRRRCIPKRIIRINSPSRLPA